MPQPKSVPTANAKAAAAAESIHSIEEIAANITARITELEEYMRLAAVERETLILALSKLQPQPAAISGG